MGTSAGEAFIEYGHHIVPIRKGITHKGSCPVGGIDAMNHHNLTDMFLQLIPAFYRLASIILGAYVLHLTDFVF